MATPVLVRPGMLPSLSRGTDEWMQVEYLLQLSVRTSRVRVREIFVVADRTLSDRFQKRIKDGCVVYSLLSTDELGAHNPLQDVCRRGINVGMRGMKFPVGNFSLPSFPLLQEPPTTPDLTHSSLSPTLPSSSASKRPLNVGEAYTSSVESEGPATGLLMNDNQCEWLDHCMTTLDCLEDEKDSNGLSRKNEFLRAAKSQMLTGERRLMEYILCQVAVGRAITVEDEKEAFGNRFELPLEFDSAFLEKAQPPPNAHITVHYKPDTHGTASPSQHKLMPHRLDQGSSATLGVLPPHTFRHEYVVYDSSQVLPNYLIKFEYDPSYEELFAVPLCDNCGNKPASLWCHADSISLCKSCDESLHAHNAVVMRHLRLPLNEMPRPYGLCSIHREESHELFCTRCSIPVCRLCRSAHNHRDDEPVLSYFELGDQGHRTSSTLLPLYKAYKAALQSCMEPHPILSARRKEIAASLERHKAIVGTIDMNSQEAEQSCYAILERALHQLKITTEDKMSIVLGDQQETRRQLDELQWASKFLRYQQSVLPPPDFLQAWLQNCRLRRQFEQQSAGTCQLSRYIFADMILEGRVDIKTDTSLRHTN
eukprot:GHVQ01000444.1.p1 GENE.GHVQ01000444.1~~GHVQ01000444.1.p1  ORF type:complete len:641 (-),score=117.36 GHVQ01000444.1:1679-3460(-)